MSDTRKIQLAAEMDATGVRAGTEQIKTAVRDMARDVQQQGAAAAKGVDGIGAGAQTGAGKVDRATKSIIGSIERTTAAMQAGERGSARYFETLANQRGVSADALRPYLDNLRQAEAAQRAASGSLDKMGMSAKATSAALRNVPAQFTDIVTALQGGQAPLTVLLQQGGQLKDSFGGIGAAAQALGGYVLGLVNPFSVAAAAAGVLTFGYLKGAQEATEFNRSLILTGNAAGTTAAQLGAAAQAVSNLTGGTVGRAAEVLNSIAESGAVGAQNLTRFTAAAIALERAGGPAAEKTATAFADLAKSPLTAALKLNEATNFLTRSTYEQIKALTEQGRTVEAASAAQEAYAAVIEQRAPAIVGQLGLVERAWIAIKDATKGAGDAVLSVGRAENPLQREIALIEQRIAANNRDRQGAGQTGAEAIDRGNAVLRARLTILQQAAGYEALSAAQQAEQTRQVKARADFDKAGETFLAKRVKQEQEIAQAQALGTAAGKTQAEIEQRIADIRAKYADKGTDKGARQREAEIRLLNELAGATADYTEDVQRLVRMRDKGLLTDQQYLESLNTLIARQPFAKAQAKELEDAAKSQAKATLEAGKAYETYLNTLDRTIDGQERTLQSLRDEFIELTAGKAVLDALVIARREDALATAEQALQSAYYAQAGEAEYQRRQAIIDQLKAEIALRKGISTATADAEVGRANEKAAKDAAREWQKTADQIESSLTDALLRGFESGKGFAENFRDTLQNLFKTLILRPIIQGVVQTGSGYAQQVIGLSQGGGAGGVLQGISSAGSAYNSISGLGTAGAYASNAAVYSGQAYGTGFASQQSAMLAAQESGMVSGAGASSAMSAIGYVALAVAAYKRGSAEYEAGFTAEQGAARKDQILGEDAIGQSFSSLSVDAILTKLGKAIGFNDKWASILSGATAIAQVFGRGAPRITGQGLEGSIGGGDFSGNAFADILEKGGVFRSDKRSTQAAALPDEIGRFLDDASKSVFEQVKEFGKVLGLPAEQLRDVSTQIRVALGSDEAANVKAISEAMQTYAEALAASFGDALAELSVYGETAAKTLERVAGALQRTNEVLALLGQTALTASTAGAKAALDLESLFGGPQGFAQAASSYLQAFFTDAERKALQRNQLGEQLAQFGITDLPESKAAYRALAEAQDLTTEAGRRTYAALLSLAGVFAEITDAVALSGKTLQTEIDRLRGGGAVQSRASLLASFATTTAQARAGDQKAIDALPGISKALEEAATATASSALDIARMRAWLAQSLEDTLATIPGFASGGSFAGGLRMVGENGPELEVTGPARIYSAADTARMLGGNTQALEAQIASLTEQVSRLNDSARATALHTSKTARLIERAMPDGDALATREAAAV